MKISPSTLKYMKMFKGKKKTSIETAAGYDKQTRPWFTGEGGFHPGGKQKNIKLKKRYLKFGGLK